MALKAYQINITDRDIDSGQTKSCQYCPIANAIRRTFGTENVYVSRVSARFTVGSSEYFVYLPPEAKEFINSFDWAQQVKPFSFTVEIPL